MRILALETDVEKTKQALMGKREEEVMTVHRHWLPFGFKLVQELFIGACLLFVALFFEFGGPTSALLFLAWVLWTAGSMVKAYVAWRYSFIFLTREKVVMVRQHLLYRRLLPVTLNHVQSVEVVTQYWDLFGFGKIQIHLQDSAEPLVFTYLPEPQKVARKISNIVSLYNQRIGPWDGIKRAPASQPHGSIARFT